MKRNIYTHTLALLAIFLELFSCTSNHNGKLQSQAEETATKFATELSLMHLNAASAMCTDSAKREISFYASSLTEHDIEILRNSDICPSVRIEDFEWESSDSDSSAFINIEMEDVLVTDSINLNARISTRILKLHLLYNNNNWKINRIH